MHLNTSNVNVNRAKGDKGDTGAKDLNTSNVNVNLRYNAISNN